VSVHDPFRRRWCDSPVKTRIAEYPRPDHFLLHISDTHLLAGGEQLYGTVDSEQHLRALLAEVEASGGRPEAIVFTGDLADRGQPDAYARLRALVDPAAERMGARVIWVMGNHDDRASFRQGLRDELGDTSPIDDVYWLGGLRVIVLDSTVPGHHYGDVSESQLDWLAAELEKGPAAHGWMEDQRWTLARVAIVIGASTCVSVRHRPGASCGR